MDPTDKGNLWKLGFTVLAVGVMVLAGMPLLGDSARIALAGVGTTILAAYWVNPKQIGG